MLSDSLTLAQKLVGAAGGSGAAIPDTIEVTNANKLGLLQAGKLDAIQVSMMMMMIMMTEQVHTNG